MSRDGEGRKQLVFWIEPEFIDTLSTLAAERGVSRNTLILRLLVEGVDDLVPANDLRFTRRGGASPPPVPEPADMDSSGSSGDAAGEPGYDDPAANLSSDGPTPADDTTGEGGGARDRSPAPAPVDVPADGGDASEPAPTAAAVGVGEVATTAPDPDATPAPVPVDSSSPLVPVPDLAGRLRAGADDMLYIASTVDSTWCGEIRRSGEDMIAAADEIVRLRALLDGAA